MKTITRAICLIIAGALLLMAAGCAGGSAKTGTKAAADSAKTDGETITVTDHNGDTVVLPKKIERIVVTDILPLPSVLSVFFDSAEKIVRMADTSMNAAENSLRSELYPEILDAETGFMEGGTVNVEELLKLEPDVVFYNATSRELGDQLKNAGFNAVAISVNKWEYNAIETLNNWITLLSEMFPDNDKAEQVKKYSNETYEMIQSRVANLSAGEKVRTFFLFKYSDTDMMTSGKLFFGQWWADAIGAVNVSEELTQDNSIEVNMEQVYGWNPELIFITNFTTAQPEDLYHNTVGAYDWSAIEAVKSERVYKMPMGMYRSYTPGVDTPITLKWLAKTAYPELFEDIDITQETKTYYRDIFGIDLTDEQAEAIFAPVADAGSGFQNG